MNNPKTYVVGVGDAVSDFRFSLMNLHISNMTMGPDVTEIIVRATLTTIVGHTNSTIGESLIAISRYIKTTKCPELEAINIENYDYLVQQMIDLALPVATAIFNNIEIKNRQVYFILESVGLDYITITNHESNHGGF